MPINVQPVNKYDPSQEYAATLLKRDQIISLPNYEGAPEKYINISACIKSYLSISQVPIQMCFVLNMDTVMGFMTFL